jgi:rRNA-processing protein EBP2
VWQLDISHIDETSSSESEGFGDEDGAGGSGEDDALGEHQIGVSLAEDQDEEDEADDDIPYSDIASLNSEEKGDVTPYQRLTINNHAALNAALARIQLPLSKLPFAAHQSVTSAEPVEIKDVDDDLNRELQFYAQSLAAVKEGRRLLKLEGSPFSRPSDYFAEMVKTEEHMGRVKKKLIDEAASKRAASDARRQRDLKKFGKAVQVAKLQERDKAKKDALERINVLKRSMWPGLLT